MSAKNGADNNEGQSSGSGQTTRFPAPRPRAQGTQAPAESAGGDTISASRSSGSEKPAQGGQPPRPRPKTGRPTAPARQGVPRPQGQGGARPGGSPRGGRPQQGLVRPTPKAKVRKARLLVSKVDPWSVLKMSFLLSVALGIMTVVCAVMVWSIMDLTGIFTQINDLLGQVLGTEGGEGFAVQEMVTLGQIASFATIIAVINVVLLTVLSMLGAVLYNLSASLVGGIGVTLTDD